MLFMSSQEQAGSVGQINEAVGQMGKLTQANAAMVEQAAASSRMLSQDAEQLGGLVGGFTLRVDARRAGPSRHRTDKTRRPSSVAA